MIRIVYLISVLKPVGPIFSLRSVIKNLPTDKFEIRLLIISKNWDENLVNEFKESGAVVHILELSTKDKLLFGKRKIEKFLLNVKPDIIHSQGLSADYLNSVLTTSAKKVSTLRCYPHEYFINQYGKMKGKILLKFFLRNLKKLDHRVACSDSISERINKKMEAIFIPIPNGLDLEKFPRRDLSKKNDLRRKLNLPNNKTIFLSVGNLVEGKNPRLILESFLANENEDVLIFLGDGSQLKTLQEEKKGNDNIIFLGQVKNVREFLQASDFFISASLSEGMPNAVLEAMGTGLPVILSDIPSHVEIYGHNSLCGILFRSDDLYSLQKGLKEIKSKDYKIMSEASFQIINKSFSAPKMGERYSAFYESIK